MIKRKSKSGAFFTKKRKCSTVVVPHYEKLTDWLKEQALDAALISKRENIRYFSGFAGTAGVLAVTATMRKIFVDFRYMEQARQMAPDFQVVRATASPLATAVEWLKDSAADRIGFEEECLTVADYRQLTARIAAEKWVPIRLDGLRAVKDPAELEKITVAAAIADEALTEILPLIRPGETAETVA